MVEQVDNRTITGTMGEKRVQEIPASQNHLGDVNAHNEFPSYLSHPRTSDNKVVTPLSEESDGIIRVPSGSGYRIMTPFPWRLHEMLEDIEEKKMNWIVSWTPNGKAFQVHSPEHFTNTIIPMYFRHKRYKSFQRQLYLYGFRSLQVNSMVKGAYFHPCFIKENRPLCRQIVRPKCVSAQNSKSRQRSSRRSEGGYNHEDSRILKEPSVKQRFPETLSNNLCADGNLPYYMLGQRFDPLSDDRGVSPLISMPVMSKESICVSPFPRQSSVVSPSVDQDSPDSNISTSDIQETPTKSLYESLQRTIAGRPLPPRDYSSDPSQWETTGDVESWQRNHAGFICSMSIDNSTAVNFEASPLHNDLQLTIYGTASIQELEPYTDSIITLFGGGSDFLE